MRTWRWVTGVALAALVSVTSGCGGSGPPITSEQIAGWQGLADTTVPSAQSITVETRDTGSDMFGNSSTYVAVNAGFETNADLAASEQALADLAGAIVAAAGDPRLEFEAQYDGADADAEAASAVVPAELAKLGVAQWYVSEEPFDYDEASQTVHSDWFVQLYVNDPATVAPEWLADVTEAAAKRLGEFHASVGFIRILPASSISLEPGSEAFGAAEIDVRDLKSFKKYGIKHNCVRTHTWNFDVEYGDLRAYPVARPGGSCA